MASTPSVPLANMAETDIDLGVDTGFAENDSRETGRRPADEGGVDDGLAPGDIGGLPGLSPRTPSPGDRDPESRHGYFPVPNPANSPLGPQGTKGRVPLDVNLYATKKTVAQGMMDLALLTANANQLRYVFESGMMGGYYYHINVVLICSSIFFQVVIGIALIFLGRYNVTHENHARKADILNNWIVLGVFLISVVNVFISAFGIEPPGPALLRRAASPGGIPEEITETLG